MAPRLRRREPPPVVGDEGAEVNAQPPPAEAKGSSQHQLTGNATRRSVFSQSLNASEEDGSYPRVSSKALKVAIAHGAQEAASKSIGTKPNKRAALHAQQQDANEDENELPKRDEILDTIVVSSGEGAKKGRVASDKESPLKKARTAKCTRVFCTECLQRKSEPGENGRTRKNAKHNCEQCAELRETAAEAEQPERTRGSRKTTPAAGQERPISHQQNTRGASQPASGEPHHEVEWASDPSTESDDPDNPPIPNALNPLVNQFGVKRDLSRSSPQIQENRFQWNGRPRSGAAVRQPLFYGAQGQPSRFSDAAPAPVHPCQTVNPAWLTRNPFSVADECSIYPDPAPSETIQPTNYFERAAAGADLSRAAGSSTRPLSSGASSSYPTSEAGTIFSTTYQAPPSTFSSVPSAANQPPANLSRNPHHPGAEPLPIDPRLLTKTRHPGLKPSSTNPVLTGEPTRLMVARALTKSNPGEMGSHNNHGKRNGINISSEAQEANFSGWLFDLESEAGAYDPSDWDIYFFSRPGEPGPDRVPPQRETQPRT